jgi:hypothetical protein
VCRHYNPLVLAFMESILAPFYIIFSTFSRVFGLGEGLALRPCSKCDWQDSFI